MRHWVTLLLLMFLPLQANWVAWSAACRHESGVQAQHIGHHAHQHQSSDLNVDAKAQMPETPSTALDGDCSSCFLANALSSLPKYMHWPWVASVSGGLELSGAAPLFRPKTPPERPERLVSFA